MGSIASPLGATTEQPATSPNVTNLQQEEGISQAP